MSIKLKLLTGFTLAEVLITLGIIGIIAAMTIPTLVANYQRQQYVTGLQKAYSTTQQMLKMYVVDEGASNIGDTDLFNGNSFSDSSVQNAVDAMIRKYFKVTKVCKLSVDTSCQRPYKFLNGSSLITYFSNSIYYTYYTLDGMEFGIYFYPSCSPDFTKSGSMKAICGHVIVDVNGAKGPNIVGRDLFILSKIGHDGTLFPYYGKQYGDYYGVPGYYWQDNSTCGIAGNPAIPNGTQGDGCAARIVENGWVMDY